MAHNGIDKEDLQALAEMLKKEMQKEARPPTQKNAQKRDRNAVDLVIAILTASSILAPLIVSILLLTR